MATRQSARTLATLPREMLIEIGKNLANLADFFAFYTTFRFLRIFEKNDVVLISEWLMKNRRFPIILAIRAFGKEAAPYVQYMLARNKRLAPLPDTPRRSKRAERGRGLPRQGKWVTPCILAASKGYWEVLQVLIAAGADVNIDDGSGFTPLMAAAAHGSPRAVSMLCCAGAHLDAVCVPDPDAPHVRRTALGIACARGRVMAARLLLARGASINVEGTCFDSVM